MRRENTTRELEGKLPVKKILEKLDLNPESVIVLKDNETLTLDTIVEDDDTIEILSVVSGG